MFGFKKKSFIMNKHYCQQAIISSLNHKIFLFSFTNTITYYYHPATMWNRHLIDLKYLFIFSSWKIYLFQFISSGLTFNKNVLIGKKSIFNINKNPRENCQITKDGMYCYMKLKITLKTVK